jgi:hypothetical protein
MLSLQHKHVSLSKKNSLTSHYGVSYTVFFPGWRNSNDSNNLSLNIDKGGTGWFQDKLVTKQKCWRRSWWSSLCGRPLLPLM